LCFQAIVIVYSIFVSALPTVFDIISSALFRENDLANKPRTLRRQSGSPTITDVAHRAGVSAMTVSRVINADPVVRPTTVERVRQAIVELNYVPNPAARSLASAEMMKVAFFYSNPSSSYLSEFLLGILEQIELSGIQLVLEKTEAEAGHVESSLRRLIASRVDGIVLPPPLCDDKAIIERVQKSGISVVAVGIKDSDVSSAYIDDFRAAFDITQHLIELGHERLAFIAGNPNHVASFDRLRGYRTALEQAHLRFDENLVAPGLYTYASGIVAARQLLGRKERPTAIFASNDEMAAAVVAVSHEMGLDVPKDVSVCGFDDTILATTIWPNLTTIRQPIAQMARTAVDILAQEIRTKRSGKPLEPVHQVFECRLIARESAAPPPQNIRLAVARR
jgi:LacI family transcriptional regulator